MIFGFFGEFLAVLGGSLTPILMPVIATAAFLRTRQWASAAVTLSWSYILGRLGLLQSSETVGRSLVALGASTRLAGLALLGLDILRCRNEAASPAEPARARTD